MTAEAPRGTTRTTIRDVAEQAGVSVATVSKVLNDRYGVSAAHARAGAARSSTSSATRPASSRSSLRNHRTNVIGILVADLEPFSTELLKGAADAIRGTGYRAASSTRPAGRRSDHVGWERRYLSRLAGTLIDGAVLVTPTVVDAAYGAPIVAVDPHTGPSRPPTVDSDNLNGARLAIEHLSRLGHRRIAHDRRARPTCESARLREQGYRQALAAAGIAVDPDLITARRLRPDVSAEGAARELLDRADRPTAIFAANDMSAIATLAVASELGHARARRPVGRRASTTSPSRRCASRR